MTMQKISKCKYCGIRLSSQAIRKQPKQFTTEKQGIWGGTERPFLQVIHVICPSKQDCGKKYSIKSNGSDWFYK